jgi:hypothetical protein
MAYRLDPCGSICIAHIFFSTHDVLNIIDTRCLTNMMTSGLEHKSLKHPDTALRPPTSNCAKRFTITTGFQGVPDHRRKNIR